MSVVIPAHNEESVIGRNVARIVAGDVDGQLEIVVVANGCADETALAAARVSQRVKVIEIPTGSKTTALNVGDGAASTFPRAYVDADVKVEARTLIALADALEDRGILVASPRLCVDTRASNWLVRMYFAVWELSDYRQRGHIGSGIYALSEVGRRRFALFPAVIADDRFVQQQFKPSERKCLTDYSFEVRAPTTLRSQIRRATRIAVGNMELTPSMQFAEPEGRDRFLNLLGRVARHPETWLGLPVYVFAYTLTQVRASRRIAHGIETAWDRDESSRV